MPVLLCCSQLVRRVLLESGHVAIGIVISEKHASELRRDHLSTIVVQEQVTSRIEKPVCPTLRSFGIIAAESQ
eukprot:1142877-Pleurochrysis_carterae.AAC.1